MTRGQQVEAVREVPAGVSCQCVKNHNPQTDKLLPWELPKGTTMWLCPTTWYCVNELFAVFAEIGGEPIPKILAHYPLFARRLVKLHWQQKVEVETSG
jgi:hypothetical protein